MKPARQSPQRDNGTSVAGVYTALRDDILSARYQPGAKLPSEAMLIEAFSVSRTVVREAIAALRAEGLAVSRQGAGVFAAQPAGPVLSPVVRNDPGEISSILELLELRIAVESEAAALAAVRRSPAQEEEICLRHRHFGELIALGQSTSAADLALHAAIGVATNNARFSEFMSGFARAVIPRPALEQDEGGTQEAAHLALVHQEHGRIVAAITMSDRETARQAMRAHLEGGLARYRVDRWH